MAGAIRVLSVIFLFSLMSQGTLQQCQPKDLVIAQKATGKRVNNKPEWRATAQLSCPCSLSNVTLSCKGFVTAESISPPNILSKSGSSTCLLNNGLPIFSSTPISFVYASVGPFPFKPIDAIVSCS